jgi:hypothetical protein
MCVCRQSIASAARVPRSENEVVLEMGLSTEGKVFIVEYYFRSYGSGRQTTHFSGFERPDVNVQKPLIVHV